MTDPNTGQQWGKGGPQSRFQFVWSSKCLGAALGSPDRRPLLGLAALLSFGFAILLSQVTAHAKPLTQLPVPWWDSAWGFARTISVSTGPNAPFNGYNGYSVVFRMDTSDASRFLANCDDLRIVYWDGSANVELDRVVYGCGTASTEIWFSLQSDIPDSSVDSNYFVYYGNPSAGSPPDDPLAVYLWWDDFSTDPFAVGSPRYSRTKAVDIHGTGYALPSYDSGNQRVTFDTGDNVTSDFYVNNAAFAAAEQDVLIQADHWADLNYPTNATDTIVARVDVLSTSSSHVYLHFSHGSYSVSPGCSIDSWSNGERNRLCGPPDPVPVPEYWAFTTLETWTWATYGTSHTFWRDAGTVYASPDPAGRTAWLTGTLTSPQAGYVGLAPAQSRGYWDNLIVRRYTDPEPNLGLSAEEVYSPPEIVDPKVDSLFSDLDGDGRPSPGDILGYSVTITNAGGSHATNVVFADTPDINTTLEVGSVTTSQGTVTGGNGPGDTTVGVNVGTLAPGDAVTIAFQVAIGDPLPLGIDSVANQGAVSGDNFPDTVTDDPATVATGDPTVTQLALPSPQLPATGFAPGRRTLIPQDRPAEPHFQLGDMTLEIPRIDSQSPIVGVRQTELGWDVRWLSDHSGYLEGSAFPTWPGNTVITGHIFLSDGTEGPFHQLGALQWDDEIAIHAFGQRYIYAVREVRIVDANDRSVLQHKDLDWLTLLTCSDYDAASERYRSRLAVQAVLMRIEAE